MTIDRLYCSSRPSENKELTMRCGHWRHFGALVLMLSVTGCGGTDFGPTGTITGKLTLLGKPIAAGTAVSFMQMEKGFLAFGLTDEEGKFEVKSWNNGQMPVGKYKVMIAPAAVPPAKNLTPEEAFDHPELVEPATKADFPKKYRDTQTSGLEYEIKEGPNDFEIDLKP